MLLEGASPKSLEQSWCSLSQRNTCACAASTALGQRPQQWYLQDPHPKMLTPSSPLVPSLRDADTFFHCGTHRIQRCLHLPPAMVAQIPSSWHTTWPPLLLSPMAPYPLCQLCVHHEVVDVLLSFGELQLPGHHSHHQCCTSSTLCRDISWGNSLSSSYNTSTPTLILAIH